MSFLKLLRLSKMCIGKVSIKLWSKNNSCSMDKSSKHCSSSIEMELRDKSIVSQLISGLSTPRLTVLIWFLRKFSHLSCSKPTNASMSIDAIRFSDKSSRISLTTFSNVWFWMASMALREMSNSSNDTTSSRSRTGKTSIRLCDKLMLINLSLYCSSWSGIDSNWLWLKSRRRKFISPLKMS